MPRSPIVRQVSSRVRLAGRKQQRADRGPAEAIEPQPAVRFEHMAVRAHPTGLPAAAGEIPLAGQAIACVNRTRARSVWRSPGHDAARISEDGVIGRGLQIGGNQAGTVGDECVPRDRGVVPGELFDRRHVERRLRLAARRAAACGTAARHGAAPATPRGCAACARSRRPRRRSPPRARGRGRPGPDWSGCPCATSNWQAIAADRPGAVKSWVNIAERALAALEKVNRRSQSSR